MKDIAVLVMSCNSYEDTWGAFGKLFKKYWNCPYKVYFGTETEDNKEFTTIKTSGSWTSRVRQTLEQIDTKYVIFLLDDFFVRKQVRQDIIDSAVAQFDDNTAVFNFELNKDTKTIESSLKGFKTRQNNQMYLCSCQPSLWDRKKLISLLQKDMTPWEWETQILDSSYKFNINTTELVFDIGYYEDREPWGMVQGKWAIQCVDLFKKENIKVDFSKRGFIDKKLSIITPYYKTLTETKRLAQILEPQLTNEVEWIIIDDGCNEKELDTLNAKVIHKENGGVSSARNTGLNEASGRYVAFIDSDDMVSNEYVKTILNKMIDNFDYCYISWKDTNNQVYVIEHEPPEFNKSVWNCVYSRKTIGTKRFRESLQYGEDWDFNTRVRKGIKANIKEVLYIYNVGRTDSLTDLYCKGKLLKEKPLKAQIVMFLKAVSKIGGVETFLYEFFKEFYDKYDILFLYEDCDPVQLLRYRKLVKCTRYLNEKVECDVYLNVNCTKNIADNVNANLYYDMAHTDYTAMGWKYNTHPKTNITIAVSNVVKGALLQQYPNLKVEVISNLLNIDIKRQKNTSKKIELISATRLSWEKGYSRMKTFAKELNKLNIKFNWSVFTNDIPDEDIPNFTFKEPCLNVVGYVAKSDYLVQLSNNEADGYSTKEAMYLGVPVIATNYPAIYEQGFVNGKHGYILEMDMSNMKEVITNMVKRVPVFEPIINNDSKKWIPLLGKQQKSTYVFNPKEVTETKPDRWICMIDGIRDEQNTFHKKGEEAILNSGERIRTLLDHNMIERMEE